MMIYGISAGIGLTTFLVILGLAHRDAYEMLGRYDVDDGAGDSWLKKVARLCLGREMTASFSPDSFSDGSMDCHSDSGGDGGGDSV